MAMDLYAGIHVADYPGALAWYALLFGPADLSDERETVWDLAEHRSVFIEHSPERAGHARHSIFVDDLDARVNEISARGLEPAGRETYPNGVRKVVYRDHEGNDVGFGGARVG